MVANVCNPSTPEAEAEESLEPHCRGCSEPRSSHCTPAWATEQDSVSKKKKSLSINGDRTVPTSRVVARLHELTQ